YELNSSLTGLISASYDIAFCLLSLFVSYFGERGHKPRWLAFSAFMLGLGSLVFSLPHFKSGKYQYGDGTEDCENCRCCNASTNSSLHNYLYVFIVGQLLLGVGGTPLYTLGTAFIDDSVPKHKSSLYIGIGYAMSLLGPAIGYVLGGQLLKVYIDIQIPESTKLNQDDPRWLGAWWIGFLACFFAIWLLIIPFSCFPRHLPGKGLAIFGYFETEICLYLWILLKNPVLMSLIIASSSEALVATGFATFLPKFIENQFGKSSSFSATLGGIVLIPAAALGQVISGVLVSKFKMSCRAIIKFMISTCSVALILNTVFLFAKCGNEPFAAKFCLINYLENGSEDYEAVPGKCPTKCNFLPLFLTFFFFAVVFTFMAVTPTTVAILRYVFCYSKFFKHSNVLMYFLGTIPGPILFGVAIDNSCTLWDINECEAKGACWICDNEEWLFADV
uniref:Major facilitator superfamily (MFS) profile domain-containing protein n=1 Tax=Malurus cyaneus samueli TaxID=2593467 RepID=A0A8C5TID2_9PASS